MVVHLQRDHDRHRRCDRVLLGESIKLDLCLSSRRWAMLMKDPRRTRPVQSILDVRKGRLDVPIKNGQGEETSRYCESCSARSLLCF